MISNEKFKFYKHPKYDFVNIIVIPMRNIKKIDFALCKQPTETPDDFYKRQAVKPDIVTNGGFFSMSNGETCFGFRDEGKPFQFAEYNGVGITGDKTLSYGQNLAQASVMRDFISAYPVLVEYGRKIKPTYATNLDYNARRTAFGWNDESVFIVTVDLPGLKFSPLSDIFIELKAKFAINLDGGGSTRMLINGQRKTNTVYARPVDNVLCIYLNEGSNTGKQQENKTDTNTANTKQQKIWRVQVGAFANKDNAEKLMQELKINGFPDGYIVKVAKIFKVQVGAFANKDNAEKLKAKLNKAGYDTLITYIVK